LKKAFGIIVLCAAVCSCTKNNNEIIINKLTPQGNFKTYTISAGQHSCSDNVFIPTSLNELKFKVKFDSAAIYSTADPQNQSDINKLYGFADNNAFHQQYSARFGWRWGNNALRLFGYVYNNGVRKYKELTTIDIGKEHICSILITPASYIFSVNGNIDSLPRLSVTPKAEGYKLYPYFGGEEVAPHKVAIFIKDL